jgi:hypothetical protein
MDVIRLVLSLFRAFLLPRSALAAENLALRHQLGVLQRSIKRPRIRKRDRIPWMWLSRIRSGWPDSLVIVKPETVIRWHRDGFRLYWRRKSRKKPGRPKITAEIRSLIRRMCRVRSNRRSVAMSSPSLRSAAYITGTRGLREIAARSDHHAQAKCRDRTALVSEIPSVHRLPNRLWAPGALSHRCPRPSSSAAASADGVFRMHRTLNRIRRRLSWTDG